MVDNIVQELNELFDVKYIQHLVKNLQGTKLLPHQNNVEQDQYLLSVKNKYPFLGSIFNVYRLPPKTKMMIHIDAKRNAAINIPISGVENSFTIFYKFIGEPKLKFIDRQVLYMVDSPVEEIFRFNLKNPTLINNSIPHNVDNFGNDIRIIFSWSIQHQYSFSDIQKYFQSKL